MTQARSLCVQCVHVGHAQMNPYRLFLAAPELSTHFHVAI